MAATGQGTPGPVATKAQDARGCLTLSARINALQQLNSQPLAGLQRNLGVQSREHLRARACSRPGKRPPRPPTSRPYSPRSPAQPPSPTCRPNACDEVPAACGKQDRARPQGPQHGPEPRLAPQECGGRSAPLCGLRADLAPPSWTTRTRIPAPGINCGAPGVLRQAL